jgi:8-oxo-dGTP diphosphatase
MTKPFHLVMKVVLHNDKREVLLIKRSMKSKSAGGKWEFPGGKVDPGEIFTDALAREVKEETNLSITVDRAIEVLQHEIPDKIFVFLIVEGTLISGSLQLSDEHTEYAWVPREKLPAMDLSDVYKQFALNYSKAPEYLAFKANRMK